ncbi:MAG: TIGR00730 family Rossman fold protein [Croceitalea sp.]|nr:TIGR00730 family Rossman fold protein [Croceitalea sp.]
MKSVVVFCGSSEGNDINFGQEAYALGKFLALQGIRLIYGGAKIGVMGQVAKGVLDNAGEVIGVIPKFLMKKEVFHPNLTQLIITKDMHERKLKMHELSDGIIMLPGGYGTLEEFFEMLTWGQLGLHQKPMGILNTNGFYDHLGVLLKSMVTQGFVAKSNYDMILNDVDIARLLSKMSSYDPLPAPQLINKEQL